ncbi:hypothetical protein HYALB_00012217 [Hymenoscyphus albidus]|uniref:Uncharacterized protein n=1 Tax=Hymenoscyphus albidus TaxID=595503 RepID=A0A9N9LUK5_9HELO|nr:hypothetical protein HYALB_00012217 [Hymenoscyphus albidus]
MASTVGNKKPLAESVATKFKLTSLLEFDIKGDNFEKDGLKTPAFSAACTGKKENEIFVACTFNDGAPAGRSLGSRLEPSPITSEFGKAAGSLIISYQFTDAS